MITFIVNEASGRGRAGLFWREMRKELLRRDIAFRDWRTLAPGEATALAHLLGQSAEDVEKVVVVGGDGTVNEVLNGISDFERVALGVVPIGSGNDFARGLHLPRRPQQALERVFTATGDRRIDLGEVVGDGHAPRRFAISAGVGMDAWVCRAVDASRAKAGLNRVGLGSLTYAFMTLSAVWQQETASGTVRFETPEGTLTRDLRDLIFLACMNFSREGGGVPIAPGADPADGCFSVCLAGGLTRAQVYRKLPLLAVGRHTHTKGVTMCRASRVEVHADASLVLHADGEVPGSVRDAVFTVRPQALRVLA